MTQPIDARFARQFLERLCGAANARDAKAMAALRCVDVVWEDSAAPRTCTAPTPCTAFIATSCFPRFRCSYRAARWSVRITRWQRRRGAVVR